MNKKQAVFRILVLLSLLYLIIYLNWYCTWGSVTPDHVWYIAWHEFFSLFIQSLRLILVWLIKMFIKATIVGAFGSGLVYGLFRVDNFLGQSPNHSAKMEEKP